MPTVADKKTNEVNSFDEAKITDHGLSPDVLYRPLTITIFIPDRDAFGSLINVKYWIDATCQLLTHKFGGASVSPAHRGFWHNSKTRELINEQTYQITVFTEALELKLHAKSLKNHLLKFGRETQQGEVLLTIDNLLMRYTDFAECNS